MNAQQEARDRTGERGASKSGPRAASSYGNARRQGRPTAKKAPTDGHFVSLVVAAELVGVSVKTLRRRIAAHVLPAYRLGGGRAIRVNLGEVRDALLIPYDEA
ncbi:excisionase family DNA binding protein [Isoptericola jiangsuensis]|uniref:Excisionase family DNA binding protein n=2 Tax=Isoptericola jiangsuensis TaxID=548579 RepID=A0A2A9EZW5_9MICO|nr:excisionase family DNA binding protein [Isoptericola jiangsuensis]